MKNGERGCWLSLIESVNQLSLVYSYWYTYFSPYREMVNQIFFIILVTLNGSLYV